MAQIVGKLNKQLKFGYAIPLVPLRKCIRSLYLKPFFRKTLKKYKIMEYTDVREKLIHYYELDRGNCYMSNEQWVEELAECMTSKDYLKKFLKEYKEY